MPRASMLLAAVALTAAADVSAPLTRLFTTPAERARLDAVRNPAGVVPARYATPAAVQAPVTLRGVVVRSHGAATVWVNGSNTLDSQHIEGGVLVAGDGIRADAVTISLPGQAAVELRPGETYHPGTRRIERLEVRRHPQQP